jgi:superfamily II DNA/RNA helicase
MQEGYNADSLHGELSQVQRDTVMQKFRIRNIQILVATDVAARGLDVDDLTHVINYGLPMTRKAIRTVAEELVVPEKQVLPSPSLTCAKKVNYVK